MTAGEPKNASRRDPTGDGASDASAPPQQRSAPPDTDDMDTGSSASVMTWSDDPMQEDQNWEAPLQTRRRRTRREVERAADGASRSVSVADPAPSTDRVKENFWITGNFPVDGWAVPMSPVADAEMSAQPLKREDDGRSARSSHLESGEIEEVEEKSVPQWLGRRHPDLPHEERRAPSSLPSMDADYLRSMKAGHGSLMDACRDQLEALLTMSVAASKSERRAQGHHVAAEDVKKRVAGLLTDDLCRDFLQQAMEAAKQLAERNRERARRWREQYQRREYTSLAKRAQDVDQSAAPEEARKRSRHSVDPPSAVGNKDGEKIAIEPIARNPIPNPSTFRRRASTPKAPKAMRAKAQVAAAETFLATLSSEPDAKTSSDPHPQRARPDVENAQMDQSKQTAHRSCAVVPSTALSPPSSPCTTEIPAVSNTSVHSSPHIGDPNDNTNQTRSETDRGVGIPWKTFIKAEQSPVEAMMSTVTQTGYRYQPNNSDDAGAALPDAHAQYITLQSPAQGSGAPPPPTMGKPVYTRPPPPPPPPTPPPPRSMVPGLWSVLIGKPSADTLESTFNVDPDTAAATQRWQMRRELFTAAEEHVAVHLLCLPLSEVNALNQRLIDAPASAADVAHDMWTMQTKWPEQRPLMIQLHPDEPDERTWWPTDLTPDTPLDITASIRAGENRLRIVQLDGMSDCVFVLHAGYPDEHQLKTAAEQRRRDVEWDRMVVRMSLRSGTIVFPNAL